ncbi:energy-coupling factor transporter transmembrane component T [Bifidobacterium choloepi]|uniref:Energy-coupling factor transporter transmembrane protein EcfT n=1 Tax=Bifidobacterium choloepi TaxID=2614131 RepID=A0A6I5MZ45_9BIFI|nr:energy-coupling factor transporter transmembrane component T [Bifidobacterium choloepi]NEG69557.1 energy-coupling factor transporter transmembrane protein EcfT [Bifidobacterium choloepi]
MTATIPATARRPGTESGAPPTATIAGANTTRRLRLDPRTKILLVVTISTIVIAGGGRPGMEIVAPALAVIPFVLLLAAGRRRFAAAYAALYAGTFAVDAGIGWLVGPAGPLSAAYGTATGGAAAGTGVAVAVLDTVRMTYCGVFAACMPGIAAGVVLVSTTTVGEFMAAMDRWRVPSSVTIPLAVVFRFLPTVAEEHAAIGDAMRQRGIMLGGSRPWKMLEYRLVPLIASCVKIGDDLSAAALTRGLGAPVRRTSLADVGFRAADIVLLGLCAAAWAAWIVLLLS